MLMSDGHFGRCDDCEQSKMLYPEYRDGDDRLCKSCYETRAEEYSDDEDPDKYVEFRPASELRAES